MVGGGNVELVILYLIFALAVGFIAGQRGRFGFGWFLVALLISPLIAVIVLALIPSRAHRSSSTDSRLGDQVRDKLLEERFAKHIRGHKPAFAYSMVYDVEFGGEKRRCRSKAEAIAFCLARTSQEEQARLLP
jgi:hypothetical protein